MDHSTVLYETPDAKPLLRLLWNHLDPNYLATFSLDSSLVTIIDARSSSLPLATLSHHAGRIQSMKWAPHAPNQLITCDEATIRMWDLGQGTGTPVYGNQTAMAVQQIIWPSVAPDWLCLGSTELVQVFQN